MLLDPDNGLLITLAKGLLAKQWRCAVQLLMICLWWMRLIHYWDCRLHPGRRGSLPDFRA